MKTDRYFFLVFILSTNWAKETRMIRQKRVILNPRQKLFSLQFVTLFRLYHDLYEAFRLSAYYPDEVGRLLQSSADPYFCKGEFYWYDSNPLMDNMWALYGAFYGKLIPEIDLDAPEKVIQYLYIDTGSALDMRGAEKPYEHKLLSAIYMTEKKTAKYFAKGTRSIFEAIKKGVVWEIQLVAVVSFFHKYFDDRQYST